MAQKVTFFKYEGTGNDFVLFPPEVEWERITPERIRFFCDRHFGIGADGVLFVAKGERTKYMMRMFNPDGSQAQMCGNGIRCFAKYLKDAQLIDANEIPIESLAGVHLCRLFTDDSGEVCEVEVKMGKAEFDPQQVGVKASAPFIAQAIEKDGFSYKGTAVSMGNPHLVIFDPLEAEKLPSIGPLFEHHEAFPERTNVEFVEVLGENHLKVNVWERGAGVTLACGTGACATVAAAAEEKRVEKDKPVFVDLPGGQLTIRFDEATGEILMKGPAKFVFKGEIEG